MKLVIPMAGKDELQPYSSSRPNSLINIAGKPLIAHLLDRLADFQFEKVMFIVDREHKDLRKYITQKYKFESVFIKQKERKGPAHAIYGARKHFKDEEIMILFADTLIDFNHEDIKKAKCDGIIWTETVSDPTRYGVVFTHEGAITRLVEKPDMPISDKAIVGMYYLKKSDELFQVIEDIIKHDIKTKGLYQLTDAFQLLINKNFKIIPKDVKHWNNCDTPERLLRANRYLLKTNASKTQLKSSIIIPPVSIDKTAELINCIIGPNVSVSKNCTLINSRISESIIDEGSIIEGAVLDNSVIGRFADIKSRSNRLNIGDYSEIHYS